MSLLTTAQVCALVGKTTHTIKNWRAGYRWKNGMKKYFFDDHSFLAHSDEGNKVFYEEADVLAWSDRLKAKPHYTKHLT